MKHIFLSLSMILSTYVLADEWLDIAQDLQTHIEIQVPISIDTQQHIDTHLLWAYQCY